MSEQLNSRLQNCVAIARQGRVGEAIDRFRNYISRDPNSIVALNWLSILLRDSGQAQAALPYSERAVRLNQNDLHSLYNLGLCYFAMQQFEAAIYCLERTTVLDVRFAAGHYALGCVYEAIGQPWQALIAIKANVEIDPYPEGFLKLGQLYLAVEDLSRAVECANKALEKQTTSIEAHMLLAEALADSNPSESEMHYQKAVSANPSLAEVFANLRARRLTRQGRIAEAAAINAGLIEQDPKSGVGYLNLVTIMRVQDSDRDLVQQMESTLGEGSLPLIDTVSLHYALGKSYDNLGDCAQAIEHYDAANSLNRQIHPSLANFDRTRFERRIDLLMALFSKEFIAKNANHDNRSSRPIFIVGMMRSGTTLAEQVLSSHSQVAAAGELAHWSYSERKIVDFTGRQIHRQNLLDATESYLQILSTVDSTSLHVTDKNPANCFALGLIALAFPRARIVSMNRDPIETALSIFMTPTRHPPEFGCDRENIVFAIRQTRRLMRHWQSVLPLERLHEVKYEDIVSDQEGTTRRLIEACGLNWEDSCLHPESNNSLVNTPSMWQVRQPLYATSVRRSERYAPWLGAFDQLRDN